MVQRRGAAYKHPPAGIPGVKSSLFHVDVQGASSYANNDADKSAGELDSPDALVDAHVVESQAQFSESATISASVGSPPPSKSKRSIYDIENGIDAIENEIKEAIAQLSVARDSARPKLQAIAAEDAMPDFVDRKMAVSLTAEEPARLPLTTHFDVHAEF